ncbi:MAG: AAA family ATPase [Bacteroidota bacterium]
MSSLRPLEIEMIRTDARKYNNRMRKAGKLHELWDPDPKYQLLQTKTANDWLKQEQGKPAAQMLFGSLWFEGELCILFADTNMGKSVLAVQIGDLLTQGMSLQPLNNHLAKGAVVLYIDFELSARQFEARYTNHVNGNYRFDNNFFRSEFNPLAYNPDFHRSYEEFLNAKIERALIESGARILIIDNITYMRNGNQQARDAAQLMQDLKMLKIKRDLSILVLAHTPKRNPYKPLTVNDLQGSKMLINFADSAFAIGQSHTRADLRYLKQIKQRNQRLEYGEDNICLLKQEKQLNCLRFTFEGHAHERDHLLRTGTIDKEAQKQQVMELHGKGRSLRQIAGELSIPFTTVGWIIRQYKTDNERH